MAELTESAGLILELHMNGWNDAQIGRALGINGSLVRQAYNPSKGGRQKPLTKYQPALRELLNKRPGEKASSLPGRRTTKSGEAAAVRKGVNAFTTKKGSERLQARGKNAPASNRRVINDAARKGKNLRWDVKFNTVKTDSDEKGHEGWVSGHLPSNWTAADLMDRVNNPQAGDNWKAGDVNGALTALALEQNASHIIGATGRAEISLYEL